MYKKLIKYSLLIVLPIIAIFLVNARQNHGKSYYQLDDTSKVILLCKDAKTLLEQSSFNKAFDKGQKALEISKSIDYTNGKILSHWIIAKCYNAQKKPVKSLEHYVTTNILLENEGRKEKLPDLYLEIADFYQKNHFPKKSIEYLNKYKDNTPDLAQNEKKYASYLKKLGNNYYENKEYGKAQECYKKLMQSYKGGKIENNDDSQEVLEQLSDIEQAQNNWDQSLEYEKAILKMNKQQDLPKLVESYNNIAYIYQQKNQVDSAHHYLQKAYKISEKENLISPKVWTNLGIVTSKKQEYEESKKLLNKSLEYYKKQNNLKEIGKINNALASHHYYFNKYKTSERYAKEAIQIGQNTRDLNMLKDAYQILSAVSKKTNNHKESQEYFQKYTILKDSLNKVEQLRLERLNDKNFKISNVEKETKLNISEDEKQKILLKQTALEKEKAEKDLKNKELQETMLKQRLALRDAELIRLKNSELEKQKKQQNQKLRHQKEQAKKQQELISLLEKNRKLKEQQAKDEEIARKAKEEQQRKLQAEKDKNHKEQIANQKRLQYYTYGIMALVGLVLIVSIFALINSRKKHKAMVKKNKEIERQNAEIQKQNDEIHKQQDQILTQNKQLSDNEKQMRASIYAALTIQTAILPYESKLNKLLENYFIIYKPKDVVSGDFYWVNEIDGKTVVVAADCTGHGVQGAFMTLIGNTLLDKIIRLRKVDTPAETLDSLHEEVKTVLHQDETGNNNGMDVVVLSIEKIDDQNNEVVFCGAKNSLFYILPDTNEIHKVKGTRKSIGGDQNEKKTFTNEKLVLPKKTLLYFGSDGFEDQNNVQRKKFGSKRLEKELLANSTLPLEQQKKELEKSLRKFMKNTAQRDDILWMGIEL